MKREVLDAIRQTASVPSMPQVAVRFIELCAREDQEYDDLVDLLNTDPGMASEVLRLANSPLFGVSRKISSLKQALTLLGLVKVRSLVIGRYLVQKLDELPCPGLNQRHFWQRSVICASLAARCCQEIDRGMREEAFMSGLLADVGVMVLAGALPGKYAPIAGDYELLHSDLWLAREQHHMGVSHAEVSALVLEDWHLPGTIVDAVRSHHVDSPWQQDGQSENLIGCLVSAASDAARLFLEPPQPDRIRDLCRRTAERTGLSLQILIGALLSIEDDLADLASLLGISVEPISACALISQELEAQLTVEYAPEMI